MSGATVFRGYDRAALDAQYNSRAAVPEHTEYYERWRKDCAEVRETFRCRLDIAYGSGPAERLDVFPADSEAPAPVLVYFHGGYWMSRDKSDFGFLARAFVPAGAALVVANYSLIPGVDMAELVRQCRAAVTWVHDSAASFGADPGRVFVAGHSAGGHLTAMMMATDWPAFAGLPADAVKGGCAVSGLYDLEPIRLCYLNDTLGLGADDVRRYSPVRLAPSTWAPLTVAVGGAESDEFRRQSAEFAAAWRERGVPCELVELPGRNHFSILEDLASRDGPLARTVRARMGLSEKAA